MKTLILKMATLNTITLYKNKKHMALITRQGKGSKLTIQEMDDNLYYLNNGMKLLCKKTVNLNPTPIPLANPIILISCLDNNLSFTVGETITTDLFGTATVVSDVMTDAPQAPLGQGQAMCMFGQSFRNITISNPVGDIEGSSIITGDISGVEGDFYSYITGSYPDEVINLDSTGSKFIITDVIVTNHITAIPEGPESITASINTAPLRGGDQMYVIENNSFADPDDYAIGTNYTQRTVGNTLYFSVTAAEGHTATADLYIYGYILE